MAEERKGFDMGGSPVEAGFPEEFDAVIASSVFQPGQYGSPPSPQLAFKLHILDPDYEGGDPNAWYSMGTGDFVILDGGLRVGGDQFRSGSKLDLLLECMRKVEAEIPPGDEASVFLGMAFHWQRMTLEDVHEWAKGSRRSYPLDTKGEKLNMLTPRKYLGKHEIRETRPAGETSDAALGDLLVGVVNSRPGLKWPGIMLNATAEYPEDKAAILDRGLRVLNGLVDAGILEEIDGTYAPPVTAEATSEDIPF